MDLPNATNAGNQADLSGTGAHDELKEGSSPQPSWAERASRAAKLPVASEKKKSREGETTSCIPPTAPNAALPKAPPPSIPAFARATKERPVIVLDAGALIRVEALDKYRHKCAFVTTMAAAQEVRDAMSRQRVGERLLDIHTLQPSASDEAWAEKFADMTGDLPFLSKTDLGLIALTYMLQRATGQTERLKIRPPALEFFSEAELQHSLESNGDSTHVWTLQRGCVSATSPARTPPSVDASSLEDSTRTLEGETPESESAYKSNSTAEDDMDMEEGWVTEEVLRDHLGLVALDDCPDGVEGREGGEQGDAEALSKAFNGLELAAHLQEVEDLVCCMTTDFSMQNVLLQMGLGVLSADGRTIRTVKLWALLCRACGHLDRKTKLLFCSKCGHYTLERAPLYFDQKSRKVYVFDGRKRFSKRGQVYSIPKETGGKHSMSCSWLCIPISVISIYQCVICCLTVVELLPRSAKLASSRIYCIW
ncbi:hypothetical protein cyc_05624 [Cyclospora cayetanensis]|uniref:Uncharacterized protein n=1 Tax=Cyclospora cayetanensis TaxID=88456 RepID=A0A1D3D7U9_9EIME|nr:hypothetical protein cyc_05624 [Cyclospora cayetanensis]